jgi:hypothetical protein
MSNNELMAIAAHMHVLLRRKAGRVTDIEWMASNHEYAQAIVQFAKAKAAELEFSDLELWALKLELELASTSRQTPRKPLVQMASESVRANQPLASSVDFSPTLPPPLTEAEEKPRVESSAPRYIGGIR